VDCEVRWRSWSPMSGLSRPDGKRLPCWPIVPTGARGPNCTGAIKTRLAITPAGLREIGRGNRNG
jgi:hypothetical protein